MTVGLGFVRCSGTLHCPAHLHVCGCVCLGPLSPPWTVSPSLPQIKYQECVQLNAAIAPFDSPKHYNWKLEVVSYFESESSQAYEDCLAEHVRLLEDFHKCVSDQLVNYDDIEQWCVAWVPRLPARIPCDARMCLLAACILPLPNPHLHLWTAPSLCRFQGS